MSGPRNVEDLPRSMDARASAEILVLGQIRDSLVTLTASLTDVRERVIRIEATDVATSLARLESDFSAGIARLESKMVESEKDNSRTNRELGERIHKMEIENARWKGLFAPLAILGSAFLSGLVTWIVRSLPTAG